MNEGTGFGFFTILLAVFGFLGLITLARTARIVPQSKKGLVMRLGKYKNTVDSGLTFLAPFIEDMITIDMRERVINVEPQKVITKDNVTVIVDAVIYYKVIDPVKAEFEVENFGYACTTLAQTNLWNLIGDRSLDETLVARDMINTNLRLVLDEATNLWGVKVTRVEVQKIDPPVDITEAMSRQMKAERDKRASILESEGIKQSQILQAEGVRQGDILRAEGEAQARVLRANAEAEAIKLVSNAAETYFKERAEVMRRLEVLNHTLANNAKFVLPSNGQLVNVLGLGDGGDLPGGLGGPGPGGGRSGGSAGPGGPSGGMGGGFGGGEIPVVPLRRS
jgi:regulator of protease activity HflC (stomatin/prohibitin superfamily)